MAGRSMDWYSWLSKTGMEASLVYEYALVFSQNELEEEDIKHLDHEFLQSMGISIAKHRLEMVKLAKKQKKQIGGDRAYPLSRLLMALKKTKKCLTTYISKLVHGEASAALVVVPTARKQPYHSRRWSRGGTMLKRNSKRLVVVNHGKLMMLTDGSSAQVTPAGLMPSPLSHSGASPIINGNLRRNSKVKDYDASYREVDAADEIKWDSMFQDMKPT